MEVRLIALVFRYNWMSLSSALTMCVATSSCWSGPPFFQFWLHNLVTMSSISITFNTGPRSPVYIHSLSCTIGLAMCEASVRCLRSWITAPPRFRPSISQKTIRSGLPIMSNHASTLFERSNRPGIFHQESVNASDVQVPLLLDRQGETFERTLQPYESVHLSSRRR